MQETVRLPKELVDYILSLLSPIYYPVSYYLIDQQRYTNYKQEIWFKLTRFANHYVNDKLIGVSDTIHFNLVQLFKDYLIEGELESLKFKNVNYTNFFTVDSALKYQMHLIYQMYKDDLDLQLLVQKYKLVLDDVALSAIELLAHNDIERTPIHNKLTFTLLGDEALHLLACSAAYMGHVYWFDRIIKGLELNLRTSRAICAFAALGNKYQCLIYLQEHGYDWDYLTCVYAAQTNSLHCLKYARLNGCFCDMSAFIEAASYGHLECLKFLDTSPCMNMTHMFIAYSKAIKYNQVKCVQYIISRYPTILEQLN